MLKKTSADRLTKQMKNAIIKNNGTENKMKEKKKKMNRRVNIELKKRKELKDNDDEFFSFFRT